MNCKNCGNEIAENLQNCPNCGAAVEAEAAPAPEKKGAPNLNGQDKLVMALLAFFLGGWGVHCFMMGEKKAGIVRIIATFCCGIGGILALIDFIMILMDKYVADPEKLFI